MFPPALRGSWNGRTPFPLAAEKSHGSQDQMMLKRWEELPPRLRTPEVRPYFDILDRRRPALALKRAFDVSASLLLLVILSPLMLGTAVAVALDSPGGVLFRQPRVTAGGRIFRILKFRTMRSGAELAGPAVTCGGDRRITRVGRALRDLRLDELPQLVNVLRGEMTFVGSRPEIPGFVARYTPQMYATLLLPAGITSEASILFKDEGRLFDASADPEEDYVNILLPRKMEYNLEAIRNFSLAGEARTLLRTLLAVAGRDHSGRVRNDPAKRRRTRKG